MAVALETNLKVRSAEEKLQVQGEVLSADYSWWDRLSWSLPAVDVEIACGKWGFRFHTPRGLYQAKQETEQLLMLANEGTVIQPEHKGNEESYKVSLIRRRNALKNTRSFGFARVPSE